MCVTVCPDQSCLVDPVAHGLWCNTQEVDLRAIVGGEMPGRLGAPSQPEQRKHEGGRSIRGQAAEPGNGCLQVACVVSRSGAPSHAPVAHASTTCLWCGQAGSTFFAPLARALASIVVTAFCP